MAVTDPSKISLEQQRQRFLLELQHLEQTYKSGLLRLQEYTLAKKAVDKKISLLEQKQKQFEAKEKAVEEILGASSMLSSQGSNDLVISERQHHKYFMKIEKPKIPLSQKQDVSSKYVPFKDLSKPALIKDSSSKVPEKINDKINEKINEKIVEKKAEIGKKNKDQDNEVKEKYKEKTQSSQSKKEHLPLEMSEHLHIPHQLPATSHSSSASAPSPLNSSASSLDSSYKDIDELAQQEDSNWRFALAILTLFLLILLYVKFTSFGASFDVLTVDAYFDITSAYSKDMHAVLTHLMSDYGQSLFVSNHIVGSTSESILAGTAALCAQQQNHGSEYLEYLFSQHTLSFATNADALFVSSTLGLNSTTFSSCLTDPTIKQQYLASQDEINSLAINYTPTVIINNKKIVGAVGYDTLKAVIDREMTALG